MRTVNARASMPHDMRGSSGAGAPCVVGEGEGLAVAQVAQRRMNYVASGTDAGMRANVPSVDEPHK